MVNTRQGLPTWISAAATTRRVEIDNNNNNNNSNTMSFKDDDQLSFGERALSAAGASVFSSIIVNPLDVAKTRLQAQAAGVPYQTLCRTCFQADVIFPDLKASTPTSHALKGSEPCPPDCNNRYKGTADVFNKVIRQEGFGRLWRGTNASLALSIPTVGIYLPCYDIFRNTMEDYTMQRAPALTPYVPLVAGSVSRTLACIACYPVELARTRMQAFTGTQKGTKPPGVVKTLVDVVNPVRSTNSVQNLQTYRALWTGLGAQLARDVPFSAICWSTLEPIRRKLLALAGDEAKIGCVVGANFGAGFVAGSLAAAATCPLDVARTRRQIEKDHVRALKMTTRQTLLEIWRDGGTRGLFTGIGPRVARAGPSVGIVVSFYEVVKYALHHRRQHID
ncbi:hypothetical protein ACFE04_026754 [Oxalis oulophora]